ncbi:dienelactone hydrolase family protein [Candidatus Methylospira mobilis]|uniref:dienelactone hydrolase family protein n=1 Tax=Candidatus Methylospira mobilis TaxID=1808979 RepID=UPI0028EA7143|nr:dienelactone hydrolase family protein [Candidatus Methylospira mobilis]WNV04667.1 dienelactone hydrolase family protein [Candidatus Methylospira mobilis]
MKRFLILLFLLFSPPLHAALHERVVDYRAGNVLLKGYLVWDDAYGTKQPAVLVVHEWWGLNDYARERARMLAGLGYTALAVDMYGEGKSTEHASDASGFMNNVLEHADVARERFLAAKALLERQPMVDASKKTAAIGYCFGGATVLNMARQGVDLAAVASFHGNLATRTPAQPGAVKARVLVLNGADDSFITQDSIRAFEQEMQHAGADYRFINYPGAVHSFTNPDADRLGKANNMPLAYNAAADKASWEAMKQLFNGVFGR